MKKTKILSAKTIEDLEIQIDNLEDLIKHGKIISISSVSIATDWYSVTVEYIGDYNG